MGRPVLEAWQERRVLHFLNAATAEDIERTITDDPHFGSGSPGAYGIRKTLAHRIVATRDRLPGGRFSRLSEVGDIYGMGVDTFHDLIARLLPVEVPTEVIARLRSAMHLVAVTGAGVSAPALAPLTPRELAEKWTPRAFAMDVEGTWKFHLARRKLASALLPNDAHLCIDKLGRWMLSRRGTFFLITQNQDGLHTMARDWHASRAGAAPYRVLELHGDLFHGRCLSCAAPYELPESLYDVHPLTLPPKQKGPRYLVCPACRGMIRPNVQWLTEPYSASSVLTAAGAAVLAADVVLFIGTSGRVPVIRWLLHEAHWHARAYTVAIDADLRPWLARDGTPKWPAGAITNAVVEGDVVDVLGSLQDAVGW